MLNLRFCFQSRIDQWPYLRVYDRRTSSLHYCNREKLSLHLSQKQYGLLFFRYEGYHSLVCSCHYWTHTCTSWDCEDKGCVQPPLSVLAHSSYITTLGLNTMRGCMWINQVYKHIVCHFTRSYQLQCQAVHHLFCGRNVHHLVAVVVALSLHYENLCC